MTTPSRTHRRLLAHQFPTIFPTSEEIMQIIVTQEKCLELAREAATYCGERHSYLPKTDLEASDFQPHRWVIDAMLAAALSAEDERNQYRAGNTELLELWLKLLDGQDIIDVHERVREILEGAGLLRDGKPDWVALEARKPKPTSWEAAVNQLVTDPAERERLLELK